LLSLRKAGNNKKVGGSIASFSMKPKRKVRAAQSTILPNRKVLRPAYGETDSATENNRPSIYMLEQG